MKTKYNFSYKDYDGVLRYREIEVPINDVEAAIAKFEYTYPDIVWRAVKKLD